MDFVGGQKIKVIKDLKPRIERPPYVRCGNLISVTGLPKKGRTDWDFEVW